MKRIALAGMAIVLAVSTAWAASGEPAPEAAKKMKPALLVMDVQNEFLPYMSQSDQKLVLEMVNGAITLFRKHGFPVLRVYHTDPAFGPKPDSPGFEFPESIIVKPEDPKIVKNYPSAFQKTDLEKILREKGVNTLFLTGLSATACVLATYHGAEERDFDVFMVKGALLSENIEYTRVIESITESVGWGALKTMLENAQK